MMRTAFAAFEANLRRGSNTWRARILASTLVPVLYMLMLQTAFGVGTGAAAALNRLNIGAGLIVFFATQTAAVDSAIPVFSDLNWHRNLFSVRYTPASPISLVAGYLGFVSLRVGLISLLLCAVLLVQGAPLATTILLTLAVALLCGAVMTSLMVACAASVRSNFQIESLQRVLPMLVLLTSGALFPVHQLPEVIRPVSYLNPFFHGVELARCWLVPQSGLALLVHLTVIGGWLVAMPLAAARQLRRKLTHV